MLKIDVKKNAKGDTVFDEVGNAELEAVWDGSDGTGGVLQTGEHSKGVITLADGTRYDVTPKLIEHAPGHEGPISHHIELQYETLGAKRADGSDFAHVCTDFYGAEAQ